MSPVVVISQDEFGRQFTASSFLAYLELSNDRWQRSQYSSGELFLDKKLGSDWVFRGQVDSDWKLLPGFWRQSADMKSLLKAYQALVGSARDFKSEEWHNSIYLGLLDTFNRLAEKKGFMKRINLRTGSESEEDINELEALAQHHGLPTKLLDWSYSPHVEAFFAAWDSSNSQSTHCSVWCLDTFQAAYTTLPSFPPINVVSQSSQATKRIRYQQGLFTRLGAFYVSQIDFFDLHGEWPDLLTALQGAQVAKHDGEIYSPLLKKILLPIAETPELLRLLHNRGISHASLFPDLDGVAKEVMGYARQSHRQPNSV
jgi:hypothetical protein